MIKIACSSYSQQRHALKTERSQHILSFLFCSSRKVSSEGSLFLITTEPLEVNIRLIFKDIFN